VSSDNPLLLFNLNIGLEWDARNDQSFMNQLRADLQRTSELLYDWTNGQAALGKLTIYHDKEQWEKAAIQIFATNRLRPSASQGGITRRTITETLTLDGGRSSTVVYEPGEVRIGATWNRFGEAGGTLGEDWPRTLAHERQWHTAGRAGRLRDRPSRRDQRVGRCRADPDQVCDPGGRRKPVQHQ
jgi:hypothetical protein